MDKKQVVCSFPVFVAVGMLLTGILFIGCGRGPTPMAEPAIEVTIAAPTGTPAGVFEVQTDFKVRRELPVVWAGASDASGLLPLYRFVKEFSGKLPRLDHDDWEDLLAGGLVTTDDDGEGWVKISDCMLIYIFQNSGLVKAACPKSDYTGGNVTCAIAGTSVFNNSCASQIIQTPSAEILLEGTWLSVTNLPERQLTLIMVFEGQVTVRPVRNFDARILGAAVDVSEGHFWFTTPGVRADPIAGLAAREPHPFDQLLPVVEELDLRPWIDRIEVRADADNVPFPEFLTLTPTRTPTPKPAVKMRLKVTSTSDWTSVALSSVGVIVEKRKVTQRGSTAYAYMEDRTIQLGQLLERAEAGHAVEIVQDITLAELAEGQKVRFKIEKGCLGETVVEVFNVVTDAPTLVARMVADVCEPRYFWVDAGVLVLKSPPTSTPTQALTRRPPTRTPTPTPKPPTHTPTPTPRKDYATPVLLEPLNQSTISSLHVTLKWGWDGTLGSDEYFDVRVWFGGQPAYGIAWTKERTFTISQDHSIWRFGPGWYHWQIVVIQGQNGQWVQDLSQPSQERVFQRIQAPQKGGIRGQVFCTNCSSPIKVRVARDQTEQWWYADDQGRFDTGLTLDPGSYYVYVSSFCGQQVSVAAGQYSDVVLNCQ